MLSFFGVYSVLSIGFTASLVISEVQTKKFLLEVVIALTTSKLNLVIFMNFLVVLLTNAANLLIYIFFGEIRPNESKVTYPFSLTSC
jgi:hypothetical protein